MELAQFEPKLKASWSLPMEELRLLPISDIQYGADGCDISRLQRHLDWGLKHGCYFIGVGDYLDVASPSNRKRISALRADLYDSVREMMDDAMHKKLEEFWKIPEVRATKGRWLGMVSGHHYWQFEDGSTTDTDLAAKLGTKYLGDGAAEVLLKFQREAKRGETSRAASYGTGIIWLHHGQGFGATAGAALNKLYHITTTFFAHVYLVAHYHTKIATKMPWIQYDVTARGRIIDRSCTRVLAATGGFLKGYGLNTKNPDGWPAAGYVEKAMLRPTALGGDLIFMRPKRRGANEPITIDVDVSI